MSGAELVVRDDDTLSPAVLDSAFAFAERVCKTNFVPASYRGKPAEALAAIMTGREIGIPPMASLNRIAVIEGKPGLYAEVMRALVLSRGHDLWFEEKTNTRVTACARRREWPEDRIVKVTWTMDDAKAAGLAGKPTYRNYPRQMLTARSTAEICRDNFADVIGGFYAVEEITDDEGLVFPSVAAVAGVAGDEPKPKRVQRKKRAQQAKAAGTAAEEPEIPEAEAGSPPPADEPDVVDAELVEEAPAPAAESPQAAEEPDVPGDDEDAGERPTRTLTTAQRLRLKGERAGLDDEARYELYSSLAGRQVDAGKDLTEEQQAAAWELFDRIEQGDLELAFDDEGKVCVAQGDDKLRPSVGAAGNLELVEIAASAPATADGGLFANARDWDLDRWKDELKKAGVTQVAALKHARTLEVEGVDPPSKFADVPGSELAVPLAVWVDEQSQGEF